MSKDVKTLIYQGCYPLIYASKIPPDRLYPSYIQTYIERDVRQLKNIENLSLFQNFIQLCAGRVGQILNLTSLGNDCGISDNTARQWLFILETSYIIFLLRPHHRNFSKRLIKSPKLYFFDTGLACSLLRITREQLPTHYLKGALFESLIISEFYKHYYNHGKIPYVHFWRDHVGHEVDCILEEHQLLIPIEIKAATIISTSFFNGLSYWNNLAHADPANSFLIYGG